MAGEQLIQSDTRAPDINLVIWDEPKNDLGSAIESRHQVVRYHVGAHILLYTETAAKITQLDSLGAFRGYDVVRLEVGVDVAALV